MNFQGISAGGSKRHLRKFWGTICILSPRGRSFQKTPVSGNTIKAILPLRQEGNAGAGEMETLGDISIPTNLHHSAKYPPSSHSHQSLTPSSLIQTSICPQNPFSWFIGCSIYSVKFYQVLPMWHELCNGRWTQKWFRWDICCHGTNIVAGETDTSMHNLPLWEHSG